MARRLFGAGADGLVLFNRFLQPDIDLETLEVAPHLRPEPATSCACRCGGSPSSAAASTSLAATTGVHPGRTCSSCSWPGPTPCCASALFKHGPDVVPELLDGIEAWLVEREYESVRQMQGSLSQATCPDPAAFERANYMRALTSYAPMPGSDRGASR